MQTDTNYHLDKLPEGYSIYEVPARTGAQVFKRFFGHPSGRFFDSVVRFTPHFLWLQRGMKDQECECVNCGDVKPKTLPSRREAAGSNTPTTSHSQERLDLRKNLSRGLSRIHLTDPNSARRDSSASSDQENSMANDNGRASRARRGANTVSTPLDEEGTVDVWRVAIEKFARGHGGKYDLEDDITEEESVDWVTEQDVLAVSLTRLEEQHAFVPRIGELVLWIVDFPSDAFLMLHPDTQEYRYYSFKTRRFGDCPAWRAGVVTTVPTCIATNGPMDFNDLLSTPIKRTSLTTSGFRVETMPDPNNTDKSWSKQYKYIPLRNMRPLSQWRLLLKGIKQTDLHP